MKPIRTALILVAAALAGVSALATAPAAQAELPCWRQLLDDWAIDGRIDKTYPASCYRRAIRELPDDLEGYSRAAEDISRALNSAIQANNGEDPEQVPPPDDQPPPRVLPALDDDTSAAGAPGGNDDNDGGFLGRVLPRASGAQSLPLPLVVLAGLATLLLAAAAVSYGARRVQARRAGPGGPGHGSG